MNQPLIQHAIRAALEGQWNEAIEFNLQLLKTEPENIEALNRLARAYSAIGQSKNAKKIWNKVLSLDRYNPIATKQLEQISPKSNLSGPTPTTDAKTFLDEPGKTKTVTLVKLSNAKLLLTLQPGQPVALRSKSHSVCIHTLSGEYLGSLPDDLSLRLIKFLKSGNKYDALIRRVGRNSLQIFIKEIKRAKRLENTPSFPVKNFPIESDQSFITPQPPLDVTPTGEEPTDA